MLTPRNALATSSACATRLRPGARRAARSSQTHRISTAHGPARCCVWRGCDGMGAGERERDCETVRLRETRDGVARQERGDGRAPPSPPLPASDTTASACALCKRGPSMVGASMTWGAPWTEEGSTHSLIIHTFGTASSVFSVSLPTAARGCTARATAMGWPSSAAVSAVGAASTPASALPGRSASSGAFGLPTEAFAAAVAAGGGMTGSAPLAALSYQACRRRLPSPVPTAPWHLVGALPLALWTTSRPGRRLTERGKIQFLKFGPQCGSVLVFPGLHRHRPEVSCAAVEV